MSQNKKKLSVCIIAESFYPNLDGGAVYSRLLAEQFHKIDDKVFVISRRNDPSYPSRENVSEALVSRLEQLKHSKNEPDVITFAGNGEPTMHPAFGDIINDTIGFVVMTYQ